MQSSAADGGSPPDSALDALFRAERGGLWAVAYRLTGDGAEAEDLVQEAFVRLVAARPALAGAALRAWLVRVVTNLGIDALRRRRRRGYTGPWLPAPIPAEAGAEPDGGDPERRYGRAESASFAFLLALEALGPRQRAALLLRDVLGHSVRETAQLLDTSEANVRVLHLRARRALEAYDRERCIPDAALYQRHRAALEALLRCLLAQDAAGLEALLTESVRTVTDANGAYTALAAPLAGRARVARFYRQAARHRQHAGVHSALVDANGLPALFTRLDRPVRRQAPRSLLRVELDATDRIREIQVVLAPPKLDALRV